MCRLFYLLQLEIDHFISINRFLKRFLCLLHKRQRLNMNMLKTIKDKKRAQDEPGGFGSTLMHSGSDALHLISLPSLLTWTHSPARCSSSAEHLNGESKVVLTFLQPRPSVHCLRQSYLLGSPLALADVTWSNLTKLGYCRRHSWLGLPWRAARFRCPTLFPIKSLQ